MSKATRAHLILPTEDRGGLSRLGRDLSAARRERGIAIRTMAERIQVSPSTVTRLEHGEPGVSIGVLMAALRLFGLQDRLAQLAVADPTAPESDLGETATGSSADDQLPNAARRNG